MKIIIGIIIGAVVTYAYTQPEATRALIQQAIGYFSGT